MRGSFSLVHASQPVISVEEQWVFVDTGSPFTFRDPKKTPSHVLAPWVSKANTDTFPRLQETFAHLGVEACVALLGMDQLRRVGLLFDRPRQRVVLLDPSIVPEGALLQSVPFDLPLVHGAIEQFEGTIILDTGATLGYLRKWPAKATPTNEQFHDANPFLGVFSTEVRVAEVVLTTRAQPIRFTARFGFTASVAQGLGAHLAVLGHEFLQHHPVWFGPDGSVRVLEHDTATRW